MNGPGVTQPSLHSIYHGRCVKVEDGGGVLLRGAVTHDSSFDAAESSDARYLGDFAKEKARGAAVSFVARPFPDRQVQLGLEKQFFCNSLVPFLNPWRIHTWQGCLPRTLVRFSSGWYTTPLWTTKKCFLAKCGWVREIQREIGGWEGLVSPSPSHDACRWVVYSTRRNELLHQRGVENEGAA